MCNKIILIILIISVVSVIGCGNTNSKDTSGNIPEAEKELIDSLKETEISQLRRNIIRLNKFKEWPQHISQKRVAERIKELLLHTENAGVLRCAIVVSTPGRPLDFIHALPDSLEVLDSAMKRYNTMRSGEQFEFIKNENGELEYVHSLGINTDSPVGISYVIQDPPENWGEIISEE